MLPSHPCKAPPRRDHLCAALHRPSCLCPHPQTGSTAGHSASTAHVSPLFQEQKHSWNTSQVSCRTTQNTGFLHIHTNEVYSSSDLCKKTSSNTRQDADNARTGTCNITHLTSAHQKHLLRHCHSLLADIQRKPSKAAPSNPNCPYQSFHKVVAPA